MPNIKSAQKKMRKDTVRTARNKTYKGLIEKAVKKLSKIKDNQLLVKEVSHTVSMIDKATKNHIIHKNKAARLKSRVMKITVKKT